jgi:hypothetical protein
VLGGVVGGDDKDEELVAARLGSGGEVNFTEWPAGFAARKAVEPDLGVGADAQKIELDTATSPAGG